MADVFFLGRWEHDRFLLPLLLGEKAGMRASNFLRQRLYIKSVRRNLSCALGRLPVIFELDKGRE
jgi:hypothetical protein